MKVAFLSNPTWLRNKAYDTKYVNSGSYFLKQHNIFRFIRRSKCINWQLGKLPIITLASETLGQQYDSEEPQDETRTHHHGQPIRAPQWFIDQINERRRDYVLKPGEIAVRFINTPTGEDIIAAAKPTENLMDVADAVGIKIPRYCETGICGTCSAEIEDLSSIDGRVSIRPCCTDVYLPVGCQEMVVDVFHCRNQSNLSVYAQSTTFKERFFSKECPVCRGQGIVTCSVCDGTGIVTAETGEACEYCMGRKITPCANCQGKGLVKTTW
eukprot:jgi/Galph1/738/GphlegSOOS_G5523.1